MTASPSQPRIVSLLPSATEIVHGLGYVDHLVGRSHECDFPAGVQSLPVLTRAKINPAGTSQAIHEEVEAILKNAISVYEVDTPTLQRCNPTHVITQVQCDVCAVSLSDVENALAEWIGEPPTLVPLNPNDLASIDADIQRVADALGNPEAGTTLVQSMRERMQHIASSVAARPNKPRVVTIEWLSPLMAAGNWMPELIPMAGGVNCLGEAGKHSPWTQLSDIARCEPEVLIILPCGFSLEKVREEMLSFAPGEEWKSIPAVKNNQVYLCDGNQYFNRPGPRLVESLEILAEILHPDHVSFGHRDRGYCRWNPA